MFLEILLLNTFSIVVGYLLSEYSTYYSGLLMGMGVFYLLFVFPSLIIMFIPPIRIMAYIMAYIPFFMICLCLILWPLPEHPNLTIGDAILKICAIFVTGAIVGAIVSIRPYLIRRKQELDKNETANVGGP